MSYDLIDVPGSPPQSELCAVTEIVTLDSPVTIEYVVSRECVVEYYCQDFQRFVSS